MANFGNQGTSWLGTCLVIGVGMIGAVCHPAPPTDRTTVLARMVDSLGEKMPFRCLENVSYLPVGKEPFTGCKARTGSREYYYYRDKTRAIVAFGETIEVPDERLAFVGDSVAAALEQELGHPHLCSDDDIVRSKHRYWSGEGITTSVASYYLRPGIGLPSYVAIVRMLEPVQCNGLIGLPALR